MNVLVIDADIAAKWFFDEVGTAAARRVLSRDNQLHAPDFILLEIDNLCCRRIRLGEINLKEAQAVRTGFRKLPIQMHPFELLIEPAYEIANEIEAGLYDSLYIALAALLNGRLITADKRFFNKAAASPYADYISLLTPAF